MKKLTNKIVLVTGGSGLLGSSIIKKLQTEGAKVVNIDIVDNGVSEHFISCDITQELSVQQAVSAVVDKFGCIDGLVNNAYPRTKDWGLKFEAIPLASWQKNVDFQLNSYFFLAQEVLKLMKQQRRGAIVNIASIYGMVGPDFSVYEGTEMTMPAAYAAIKGGIINLTKYLAAYFGPEGIRVNSVAPGGVFNNQAEDFVKRYAKKTPLRRMANPDDIAPAVAFLLSDDAAYITGQNLAVDGGWTAI